LQVSGIVVQAFGVAMAFQFQAVAALSPFFMEAYKIGIADIGLLIVSILARVFFLASAWRGHRANALAKKQGRSAGLC